MKESQREKSVKIYTGTKTIYSYWQACWSLQKESHYISKAIGEVLQAF